MKTSVTCSTVCTEMPDMVLIRHRKFFTVPHLVLRLLGLAVLACSCTSLIAADSQPMPVVPTREESNIAAEGLAL